jgi:hypothetical protein
VSRTSRARFGHGHPQSQPQWSRMVTDRRLWRSVTHFRRCRNTARRTVGLNHSQGVPARIALPAPLCTAQGTRRPELPRLHSQALRRAWESSSPHPKWPRGGHRTPPAQTRLTHLHSNPACYPTSIDLGMTCQPMDHLRRLQPSRQESGRQTVEQENSRCRDPSDA